MNDQDEADFSAYAAARWSTLVRSAVFLGCSIEDAHDLVQVTLLRCFQKWRRVQGAEDVDAYVYRVLVNCLRDSRRRRWWAELPTDTLGDDASRVDDQSESVVLADAVHRALADLSPVSREVVVLRYLAQLSEQQTADALGIPAGTVKSRLSRAVARLADSSHLVDAKDGTF